MRLLKPGPRPPGSPACAARRARLRPPCSNGGRPRQRRRPPRMPPAASAAAAAAPAAGRPARPSARARWAPRQGRARLASGPSSRPSGCQLVLCTARRPRARARVWAEAGADPSARHACSALRETPRGQYIRAPSPRRHRRPRLRRTRGLRPAPNAPTRPLHPQLRQAQSPGWHTSTAPQHLLLHDQARCGGPPPRRRPAPRHGRPQGRWELQGWRHASPHRARPLRYRCCLC